MNLAFGLADIKIDGNSVGAQGDAAVFSAEPIYVDVESYEAGIYDKYLEKWEVKLKVVFEEESYEKLKMAMPVLVETETIDGSGVAGLKDGGAHQRVRNKAKAVTVHPRGVSGKANDVTIHLGYPTGVFERSYGKELSKYEVEFIAFPRFADSTKSGSYFLIGEDPLDMSDTDDYTEA